MDESSHQQRMLRAVVVGFALVLLWTFVFPSKRPPQVSKPPAAATATATATTTVTAGQEQAESSSVAAVGMATRVVSEELFHFSGVVENEGRQLPFSLTLTNVGGGIEAFELPTFKERNEHNAPTEEPMRLAEPSAGEASLEAQMAGIEFGEETTFELPVRAVYEVVEKTERGVRYRYTTGDGVEIERAYRLDPTSFDIELAVTVRNGSKEIQKHRLKISAAQRLTPVMESGGFLFMPPPDHLNGVCFNDGRVQRHAQGSLKKEAEHYDRGVKWVGIDRQYFVAAIVQRDDAAAECHLVGRDKLAKATLIMPETTLRPGEERRHKFTAYLGVKKPEFLTRVDAELETAIDYRILGLNLAVVCEVLLAVLAFLHEISGSWGLAILGLTVLVKVTLFPLNQRSMKSMRAMAALKPEMERQREKYKDDRQRQAEEQMKLYRKYNINPAAGCVPMLLQMPIWFALYRSLWVSVDLYQQHFLWIPDLTAPDPFWILPVALVGVMFIQQKTTPSTMDPAQQKMMLYVMPLLFGSMMAALPAGLSFYIFVNTVLTIAQQHLINRSVGPIGGSPSEQRAPA